MAFITEKGKGKGTKSQCLTTVKQTNVFFTDPCGAMTDGRFSKTSNFANKRSETLEIIT